MRLNIDTPQINGNQLPPDLNRWFTNIVDQINYMFGNIVADTTANIGGGGAGPISVNVIGLTSDSVVLPIISSSTNPVTIQKATPTTNGFDILFSGDPGATCIVKYIAFLLPWTAQGV